MRGLRPSFRSGSVLFSLRFILRLAVRAFPAVVLLSLALPVAQAQGTSLADSSTPRVIVPTKTSPQFYVLNADGSLQGYATTSTSTYTLNCGAPGGVSVTAGTSLTLAEDQRDLVTFQTGASSLGPAVVGRSTPSSGTGCKNSPSLAIGGSAVTALLSAHDSTHQRLFVLSSGGGGAADTITSFNTTNIMFNAPSESLSQLGQGTLDTGGTYTALVTDVDGTYGDTAVTELRTDSNSGGLWIYNSSFSKATRIFGPGGVALPAIGAFIIHNPNDGGGGLLVLVNQDGLTSANIASPPTDTTPFTIIDLGQLHDLLNMHPTASSVTLPSVATINSSLGFYAMLGAAYNPINHLLYAVVGGGTSFDNLYREVVSYDPSNPSAPAETVVADVSSVPLTSSINTQLALNAASGTMQILSKDASQVYTVGITGTGNTASQVMGSTFPDGNFVPTYIVANPLLGETYIASASQVDILTRPAEDKIHLDLDLTGPETQAAVGDDSSIRLLVTTPNPIDFGLSSTNITITATPQGGGTPFIFTTETAAFATGSPVYLTGTFPTAGIYTLVATFPGDTLTAPATSGPVIVAVGQALFPTQTSLTGNFNSSTGAGTAIVTLTGTTYTPSGTITIKSGSTGTILTTYTLPTGSISNPINIPVTAPPSTITFTATYSGDTKNQASTSAAVIFTPAAKASPTITLTAPATGTVGSPVHLHLTFTSSLPAVPVGNIQVSAVCTNNPFVFIASIPASQAFASTGVSYDWTPTATGTCTIALYFDGDANYAITSAGGNSIVITAPTNLNLTLIAPSTVAQSTAFNVAVQLTPSGSSATGSVTVTAVKNGTTAPITLGTVTAAAASGATGTTLSATLSSAGVYTLMGSYTGDSTFPAVTVNNGPLVVATSGTSGAVLLTPLTGTFTSSLGTASAYQNFTLYNTGGGALTISSIAATGTGYAQFNGCPSSLVSGTSCQIRVNYTPQTLNTTTGSIVITDNATGSPQTISLTGTGTAGAAVVTPGTATFIDQNVGTSSFVRPSLQLKNTGATAFTVNSVALNNSTDFELLGTGCATGTVLQPNATCSEQLIFHPNTKGAKTTTISFNTSNSSVAQTVTASGTGLVGVGAATGGCVDSDGDGLCDDWETNGVWVRVAGKADQFVDLHAMGADPNHKDIFVQADYMGTLPMTTGEHSHQMTVDAEKMDITAFSNAPVMNLDKTTGIHLHVDCGSACIMDPVKNTTWGQASLASDIVEQKVLDSTPADPKTGLMDWTLFDKDSTGFLASGRSLIFHHVIFAHDQHPSYTASGLSRDIGASDFVVTFGGWPSVVGTTIQQAGTMMHELGHNLGLHHGGNDDTNYKPNYLSVMNYNFTNVGMIINGKNGVLDYSRFALPTMDETRMLETNGLNIDASKFPGINAAYPNATQYGTYYFCYKDNPLSAKPRETFALNAPTNWDCDTKNTISPRTVQVDTNVDNVATLLPSFNDWPALIYNGGSIGGGLITTSPHIKSSAQDITWEEQSLRPQPYSVSIIGLGAVHSAPGSTMTLSFVITNGGTTDDIYTLSASTLNGWVISPGVPPTLTLAAGAKATVNVTYTVPANANDGDSDRLTLRAQSQGDDNMMDAREVPIYATLTPAPVAISTDTVVFGSQIINTTSGTSDIVITNTGAAALSFGTIATTTEFAQTTTCGSTLAVGSSCTVSVSFTPSAAGVRSGTLTIADGTANGEAIALRGTGVTPPLATPEVTITTMPSATSTGQTVTLSTNVASFPAGTTPTGTVTYFNGTTQIGQATLDAFGNAVFTSTSLGAGTYNVLATYNGDATYRGANAPFTQLVIVAATPTTTALTTSAVAGASGTSITFTAAIGGGTTGSQPTGSVRFLDGATPLGSGNINANGVATYTTSTLANGTHTITAIYDGDATFGASTSTAVQEYLGTFATATALTTTASPVVVGASVTLTGTVTSIYGTPTGTVTFLDGTTTLGTGPLNGSGVATYTTTALALGTHSITAQYATTGNYTTSVSTAKQIVVSAVPDYSVTTNPTSLTITSGSTGTAVFTVTAINNYAGTINLSCGTLPSNASCSFAPARLTFTVTGQAVQSTTLTFSTTQGQTALKTLQLWTSVPAAFAIMLPLALVGLGRKRRKLLGAGLLLLVLSTASLLALSGCGGSSTTVAAPATTPVGTYSVPVTITDGTTSHSLTFPVTVK